MYLIRKIWFDAREQVKKGHDESFFYSYLSIHISVLLVDLLNNLFMSLSSSNK